MKLPLVHYMQLCFSHALYDTISNRFCTSLCIVLALLVVDIWVKFPTEMDSNRSGGREMQAQTPPSGPTLCRTGCGFYAHSAFDGMCSKCYKDHMAATLNTSASSTSTSSPPLLAKGSIFCYLHMRLIFFGVCCQRQKLDNYQV